MSERRKTPDEFSPDWGRIASRIKKSTEFSPSQATSSDTSGEEGGVRLPISLPLH